MTLPTILTLLPILLAATTITTVHGLGMRVETTTRSVIRRPEQPSSYDSVDVEDTSNVPFEPMIRTLSPRPDLMRLLQERFDDQPIALQLQKPVVPNARSRRKRDLFSNFLQIGKFIGELSRSSIDVNDINNNENRTADNLNVTSYLVRNMINVNEETNELLMELARRDNATTEHIERYAEDVNAVGQKSQKVINNLEMIESFKTMDPSFKGFLGPVYQVLINMANRENEQILPKLEEDTDTLLQSIEQLKAEIDEQTDDVDDDRYEDYFERFNDTDNNDGFDNNNNNNNFDNFRNNLNGQATPPPSTTDSSLNFLG